MANKKKHLSDKERFCIEKMLGENESFHKIARTLGRGVSTISEEVDRNGGRDRYQSNKGKLRAYWKQYRKKRDCNKVAMNGGLGRFVEKSLGLGWSPETIRDRIREEERYEYTSAKSIRRFIDKRGGLERFLFWRRNHHKSGRKKTGGVFLYDPGRRSIDFRPFSALYTYGHWEMDFIVSKWNSCVLLVLVEKYSKILRLALLPNRNNDLVNEAVVYLLSGYVVNSLTTDNDIAFGKWRQLEEKLGAKIYFCHPYHSWEKGLVENTNRWIRQFIPKRTNLQLISNQDLKSIEDWFNHTPKQCLDGRTSYEIMMEEGSQQSVRSLEVNLPSVRIWG